MTNLMFMNEVGPSRVLGRTFNKLLMAPVHVLPMGHRPTKLWYHPFKLDVEATTRCNMSCEFCYRKYLSNLPERDLKPEVFERILEVFTYSEMINFVGLGEPLLNRHFLDEIAIAKADGRKVCFTTNGVLIGSDTAEKIVSLGVDELYISLDAVRPRTSEALGRGNPDHVISGIKTILSKRKDKLPKITIQTLILRENVHELTKIGKFVKRLGLRWSLLHPFCIHKEARKFHVFGSGLEKFVEAATEMESIEVSKRGISPAMGRCYAPWNTIYVDTLGNVYACCFVGTLLFDKIEDWFLDSKIELNREEYWMGNVNDCKSIWEIWNSSDYRGLRRKLLKWQRGTKGQELSLDEYKKIRELSDPNEKFSYCKICQDRFGVAC